MLLAAFRGWPPKFRFNEMLWWNSREARNSVQITCHESRSQGEVSRDDRNEGFCSIRAVGLVARTKCNFRVRETGRKAQRIFLTIGEELFTRIFHANLTPNRGRETSRESWEFGSVSETFALEITEQSFRTTRRRIAHVRRFAECCKTAKVVSSEHVGMIDRLSLEQWTLDF